MKIKQSVLTFVILISTFLIVKAQTAASSTSTDNTNKSEITFETPVHDYGSVYQGANGNCEFQFTNTGKEPLILSDVKTSCGCTVPSWPKEPILPGKTGIIKVNYTKMNTPGIISKQIAVYSNAKNGTIALSIKGTVLEEPKINSPEKLVNDGATPLAK